MNLKITQPPTAVADAPGHVLITFLPDTDRVQIGMSWQDAFKLSQAIVAAAAEALTQSQPSCNEEALERFTSKGTAAWADVPDAAQWVRQQRGESQEAISGPGR